MLRLIALMMLALLVGLPAPAKAGVGEQAYHRAVDLVERLYLYPGEVEAQQMLQAAAGGLAEQIHWLLVETDGAAVYLRHGDGTPIGSVSVASMQTLPAALRALEAVVRDSGYDYGDVDVRMEVLKGAMFALDRYSRVLEGERLDRFDVRLKGTLVGVGATLRVEGERLLVTDVVEGGPAERGGLLPADHIVRIDGTSTLNMPIDEAIRRIRGELDSVIRLSVQRAVPGSEPEAFELVLRRAEVVVPNVRHRVLADDVAYLRIDHFSQRTVENLVRSMRALRAEGALGNGLVLDLRRNTGGSMKEAARTADLFLTEGLLLRTVGPDGRRVQNLQQRMDASRTGLEPPVPLVLLVDERTASGSEILAGALLEHGRAVLVGTRTYGKGSVQKIYNLDRHARLKLTVAQYLLANDRRIANGGLVPDKVVGSIRLDQNGVRFRGFEERRTGVTWEDVIPAVYEHPGWREDDEPAAGGNEDVALELARRTVLASSGPTRRATLEALGAVAQQVRAEQEHRLVEALQARHIDWTPAPEEGPPMVAQARLYTVVDPEDPDRIRVEAQIENHDERPLHRAVLELACDSFGPWSGLVVPVGYVAGHGRALGQVTVALRPGIDLREDVVQVTLRAHRRPPQALDDEVLRSGSSALPRLAAEVQLGGEGELRQAEVRLRNLSPVPVEGVALSFAYPGELDVELVEPEVKLPTLAPRGEGSATLSLRLGEAAPLTMPLRLVVEADGFDRPLATWPLALPVDGTPVTLDPPRIHVRHAALSAPVASPFVLPLQVTDDSAVDHVVVWANGAKVAWAGGGSPRVDLRAEVQLRPGVNRIVAVAQDDQGLVTRRVIIVRGESQPASVEGEPVELADP